MHPGILCRTSCFSVLDSGFDGEAEEDFMAEVFLERDLKQPIFLLLVTLCSQSRTAYLMFKLTGTREG